MVTAKELVQAGVFPDEDAATEVAFGVLWRERPDVRIGLAIHRYQIGEISLAKAASVAGLSYDQMKEVLMTRGIQPRLGPQTADEAREDYDAVVRSMSEGNDA